MRKETFKLLWAADPCVAFDEAVRVMTPAELRSLLFDCDLVPSRNNQPDLAALQAILSTDDFASGARRIGLLTANPSNR
jgi:hypothetical protein